MFQKILVPLDGSTLSERALHPALALAKQGHSELLCLSVTYSQHAYIHEYDSYHVLYPEDALSESRRELTEYLHDLKNSHSHPDLTLHTKVRDGLEASVIVDTAVAEAVDLIVMSTHGRSGLTRWLLGSVTEKVLQRTPCPVLVIRRDEPISKILITIDGSALSESAIEPGLEVARRLGSQVTLFCAEDQGIVDFWFMTEMEIIEPNINRQLQDVYGKQTLNYLNRIASKYQTHAGEHIAVNRQVGPAAESILDYITANQIDLVVMATHGRTGLRRWLFGSVTDKVLQKADCAMLVVRPPEASLI